jgi:chromosome segregation ATPase
LLVKENKKFVKLKNSYALEVEKCANLSKELDICNDSISYLRTKNASLNAKIEELNACNISTSTVEHVTPLVLLSLKLEHNIMSISISCVCHT